MINNHTQNYLISDVHGLNNFFADLGHSRIKHLPMFDVNEYLLNISPNVNSFVLQETNQVEVLLAGLSLTNKHSCGFDGLSTNLVKPVIHLLLEPLTHIFNLSFRTGIVPQKLKIAKIVPVYKNGDRSLPINYRPISLLPTFSKLLEKLMYERLMSFVNKFNFLSECQYGFRTKRGCEDAVNNF